MRYVLCECVLVGVVVGVILVTLSGSAAPVRVRWECSAMGRDSRRAIREPPEASYVVTLWIVMVLYMLWRAWLCISVGRLLCLESRLPRVQFA